MLGLFSSKASKRKKHIQTLLYRSRELRILHDINRLKGSTHNLGVFLNKISRIIMQHIQARDVIAFVASPESQKLELASSTTQIKEIEHMDILKKIAGDTMHSAFPIVINSTKMHHALRNYRIKSLISVPLMVYAGAIGSLIVTNKSKGFTRQDLRLLSAIATQTASAIEYMKLNKEIEKREQETTALHKLLYEKEKKKAKTDEMTQLYNKRHFIDSMNDVIERFKDSAVPFSLILFDVDFFKSFNDTFGHPAGDEVLKGVAASAKDCARETDIPCRYGGEEFVILLPNTDLEGAQIVAETMRQKIEALYHPSRGDNRVITASFGVAQYHNEGMEAFINKTDQNLYKAKQLGRNMVYPQMTKKKIFA